MKALTEYERKFGSAPQIVDDFDRENAGLATQQVANSYVAKHPPIQVGWGDFVATEQSLCNDGLIALVIRRP